MYLTEDLQKKWEAVLDHPALPAIKDPYRKAVTALVLENQAQEMVKAGGNVQHLTETTPTNAAGTGGFGGGATATGPVAGFDPILISLVRRSLPNLIAYDICGVQPMTGPTGLIFAMRSRYNDNATLTSATEAFYNEANTAWSGVAGANPEPTLPANIAAVTTANTGGGVSTAVGETFASGHAGALAQMAFSIERVSVTAKTRGLQASYTLELAQDLKAIHGLDAETELTNILSTEILAEINREVVRTVYATAQVGILGASNASINLQNAATTSDGTSGRWQVEKYKALLFQIERAANKIAKDTRRGKGNMLVVSTDVASALAMTGLLDYNSALSNNTNLTVDDTGNTFAGTLFGRIKVYVDPYSVAGQDFVVVGYKGANPYDSGLFYCPYVPLQMVRAIDPDNYQPKVGFKTRYGMVANPFASSSGSGTPTTNTNYYYRKFTVLGVNAI